MYYMYHMNRINLYKLYLNVFIYDKYMVVDTRHHHNNLRNPLPNRSTPQVHIYVKYNRKL